MTAATQTLIHARWLIRLDLPTVLTIDGSWEEETFLDMMKKNDTIGFVAEHKEAVIGFMIYRLHKGHVELLRFKVHEDHRRQSVGHQLMAKLKGKLSAGQRKSITFVVSENDLDLQLFLRNEKFTANRVLPRHFDNDEDGYLFTYHHSPLQEGET